jgi:hypothetical protein
MMEEYRCGGSGSVGICGCHSSSSKQHQRQQQQQQQTGRLGGVVVGAAGMMRWRDRAKAAAGNGISVESAPALRGPRPPELSGGAARDDVEGREDLGGTSNAWKLGRNGKRVVKRQKFYTGSRVDACGNNRRNVEGGASFAVREK